MKIFSKDFPGRVLTLLPLLLLYGLLSLLGLFSAALAGHADAPPAANAPETPPYQSSTIAMSPSNWGSPLVQVKLNDKTTATFLVDTALNTSFLTKAFATNLGLTGSPAVDPNGKPYFTLGKQLNEVMVANMAIGDMTIPNVPFLILDDDKLFSMTHQSLDGIVGTNLLQFFAVAFDFPKHQFTLAYPGTLSTAAIKQLGFDTATTVPLTSPTKDFVYSIPMSFSSKGRSVQENLFVNTGAASTEVSHALAHKLGLQPVQGSSSITTTSGDFTIDTALVAHITIGNLDLSNRNVTYLSKDSQSVLPNLGMDILTGYRVLMDFPGQKMYLQALPPTTASPVQSQIIKQRVYTDTQTTAAG